MARVALSFVLLTIMMLGLKRSEGATYTVGDTTGWSTPTNADFYDTWTDNKIFRVGDVLTFSWVGLHNVAKVSEAQYDACTAVPNAVTTSPATFTLNTTGNHYFICTVGGHCSQGQKLDIEVVAGTTTPTTSPPTTTTPATPGASTPPTTTTPTTGSSPPPPAANSSGSFGPILAISAILSAIVFAFMC